MSQKLVISAALTAALTAAVSTSAFAADKERCYGISKAGHNDCANLTGTHGCRGYSKVDNDISEWQYVKAGTCESLGGFSKTEAAAKLKGTS